MYNGHFKNFTSEGINKYRKKSNSPSFSPITENYNKNMVYDSTKKTYYGFKLTKIHNYKERKKDLDSYLKTNDLNFTYFCELELVIAAIIFFRKREVNLLDLHRYFNLWTSKKAEFEDQARKKRMY